MDRARAAAGEVCPDGAFSVLALESNSAFVVVSLERLLASFSKIAAGVSIVGALSAELHSATKAIVLPLCYVLGIPAIVLSVSQTEVLALEQFGQGIQDWDFLIIFGLPLLFVGLLSVFSFFAGVDQIKVTTERLARIGVATPMINVARFIGLPFLLLDFVNGLVGSFRCAEFYIASGYPWFLIGACDGGDFSEGFVFPCWRSFCSISCLYRRLSHLGSSWEEVR